MQPGHLEERFERWRSHGDLDALSEVIDGASPELYQLAARLAPDIAQAEDLVQSTFLALLEKPRAWDGKRPLVPWMVGVLVNQARKRARQMRRPIDAERLAERDVELPHEPALSTELHSAIEAALSSLPDACRDVVARCVVGGERPIDVAHALKREPGTVRMQLLRGLELLRRALPAGLAGGGALVLAGGRGEAAVRASVLTRAKVLTPMTTGAAGSVAAWGVAFMATKLIWGAIAALVALVVWYAWPRDAQRGEMELATSPSREADLSTSERGTASSGATEALTSDIERAALVAPAATPAPSAATREGWWLVGNVKGLDPADALRAKLNASSNRLGSLAIALAQDGSYELDIGSFFVASAPEANVTISWPAAPPTDSIQLYFDHPDYLPCREVVTHAEDLRRERAPGERIELRRDLSVSRAAIVRGSVRCEPRAPLLGVRVALLQRASHTEIFVDALLETGVDEGGRFRLRAPRADRYVVQAAADGWRAAAVEIEVEPGRELVLPPLVLERDDVRIEGRVDLPASVLREGSAVTGFLRERRGAGVPRARASYDDVHALREIRGGATFSTQRAVIAVDGSFRMTGLDAGTWELSFENLRVQSLLPSAQALRVEAPVEGVVVGANLGVIRARVERGGQAVPGALTTWIEEAGQELRVNSLVADERGVATMLGDLRTDCVVSCSQEGASGEQVRVAAAARVREAEVVLRLPPAPVGAEIVLVPATSASAPARIALQLVTRARDDAQAPEITRTLDARLEDGRYRFTAVPAGSGRALVRPSDEAGPRSFFGSFVRSESFDVALRDGETLERNVSLEHGGRLRVRPRGAVGAQASARWSLRDGAGRALEGVFVSREESENRSMFRPSREELSLLHESAFEECLLPGRYRLTIESDEWSAAPLDFEIRADETTSLELPVRAR